jgi:aflatoxin B1 aldehyde reductase
VHDLKDCAEILDVFQKFGHNEIDSARTYGGGSSEEYLGQLQWAERGIIIDTKLSPRSRPASGSADSTPRVYTHKPAELEAALLESLKALNADKVRS